MTQPGVLRTGPGDEEPGGRRVEAGGRRLGGCEPSPVRRGGPSDWPDREH